MFHRIVLILTFMMSLPSAWAIEPRTGHTFKLDEGELPGAHSLEDAAWLAGTWQGQAFGKQFEEAWSRPSAGSMVGYFKLFGEDGPDMYEIMLLSMVEGRLSLKVKHFNADFTAWEEKADYVDFKFVAREENALHFSGISFYRRDADHIDAYLVMKTKDGIREEHLIYKRASQP